MSKIYETSLLNLLYGRLREGYTIKHVEIQKRSEDIENIVLKLCLAWKPQVFIEYNINAPWKYGAKEKWVLPQILNCIPKPPVDLF